MAAALDQLVYVSVATEPQTFALLNAIRRESAKHNERSEISGMLVAGGGRFVQVLEGEPVFLDGLMEKITRDTRHDSVQILDRTQVDERRFGEWAMPAQLVSEPIDGQFLSLLRPFGTRIRRRRIFERFANLQEQVVALYSNGLIERRRNSHAHTRVPRPNGR